MSMKVSYGNGNEVKVMWHHVTKVTDENKKLGTECYIKNLNNELLVKGVARLSPKDEFNKNKGRKISLAKALQSLGLQRENRIAFWKAYFDMLNKDI